jgi:hypothetical protein
VAGRQQVGSGGHHRAHILQALQEAGNRVGIGIATFAVA